MDSQSNIVCVSSEETAVINQFVGALFEPQDIVSVRFIETWTEDGQKKSQVKLRRWLRAEQVIQPDQWAYLHEQAEAQRANQFFGVCPRAVVSYQACRGSGSFLCLFWRPSTFS